ncbi:MAG: hypothetical protein U1F35_11820 [Steroidobacteraceae bacterium]
MCTRANESVARSSTRAERGQSRLRQDFILAVHGAAAAINAVTVRFLMLLPSPMHLALAL